MRQYYPNVTVIECNKRVRASIQTFENEHVWKWRNRVFIFIFIFFLFIFSLSYI
jgi:hypothetical protein